MSRNRTRISQDPRAMLVVLAVLAAMVLANRRALLPQGAAANLEIGPDEETLLPPADLRRVSAALRVAVTAPADSLAPAPSPAPARNPFAYGAATLAVVPARSAAPQPQDAERGGPRLHCSAVILGGVEAAAIIDGRMVGLGDRLGEYQVTEIDAEGVTLRAEGRTRVLAVRRARGEGRVGAPVAQD